MTSAPSYVAALPMYDWPEVRAANDNFWSLLRDSLRDFGFPAPDALERDFADEQLWRNPGLVLGQSCGLPLVKDLSPSVSVVGTPAYDIECGAGCYYSVIVVRQESDIEEISDIAGKRLAYNGANSQSGYGALAYHLRELRSPEPVFSEKICSGSHRHSARLVAAGEADIASIDAVSWRLALRHEPAAGELRVLAATDSTPGLPMICAKNPDWSVSQMHLAVVEAMAALNPEISDALLLTGFAQTEISDYAVIARRHDEASRIAL
ncbi:phosphate/phosphite/phosphonate ABC transporter substrate-binding protein [Hoeflea sp. TYP-13]|uniref:phosphate/phosphite/phosphonate ABC transporter substrate-binding protein n=1 Tax=Hoeflea sp. TYP-13 TaxID=3230023 RepID=UPI0034C5E08D